MAVRLPPWGNRRDDALVVRRVFNNSVVLAADVEGGERVLLGRGIGFHVHPGDLVDPSQVDKTFVLRGTTNAERLAALLEDMDLAEVETTQEILTAARAELGEHVGEHVFLPLADHISYALRRAREGLPEIDYQLRWEVQHLYPAEVAFSRRALGIIERRLGVSLPEVEAVPLSLHFVNAQLGSDIGTTIRMTGVLAEVLHLIRERLDVAVDEESLEVARFVTHLRYLFMRSQRGVELAPAPEGVLEAVREAQPREHACAVTVAELLAERFGWPVTVAETLYLTLHVSRLSAVGRGEA